MHPTPYSDAENTTNEGNPSLRVVYDDVFDDSSDSDLPVTTPRTSHIERFTITVDEDDNVSSADTDVTGHDQMVQDICAVLWTD